MNQKKFLIILVILTIAAIIVVYAKKKVPGLFSADVLSGGKPSGAIELEPTTPILPNNKNTNFPLKKGASGKAVKILQLSVGVPADGIFGDITLNALQNSELHSDTVSEDVFGKIAMPDISTNGFPLQNGSRNTWVQGLQVALDLTPDGIFGPKTEEAVKRFTAGSAIVTKDDYIWMLNTQLNLNYDLL